MDVAGQVSHWRAGAREDFLAARNLLSFGHVRQALFFAELALEKLLKAHVARVTCDVPPRSHDLLRLCQLAKLPVSDGHRHFLGKVQAYSLVGRYPEDLGPAPDLAEARSIFAACEEMMEWLTKQFE